MLRSWVERIRIGLAPHRVDLARLRTGRGSRVIAQAAFSCEREAGSRAWQPSLDALERALPDFCPRGGSATAVLSNAFVRYLVIPWQSAVSSASELDEVVSLRFRQTFGESADAWTIRCSRGGYGEPTVACAIDRALMEGLEEKLRAHRVRLISVQPLLMAAYNDVRRELGDDNALATIEPGRVCLALMREGRWRCIVSRRATEDPAEAIEQELAAIEPDATPAQIDVLLAGEDASWPGGTRLPCRLLGRSAQGGSSLALFGAA